MAVDVSKKRTPATEADIKAHTIGDARPDGGPIFLTRVAAVFKLLETVNYPDHPHAPVTPEEFSAIVMQLAKVAAEQLELPFISVQIDRIAQLVAKPYEPTQLVQAIEILIDRIADVLEGEQFLYIPASLVNLDTEKTLFGQAVESTFPAASEDIESAAKCLAIGQQTAAVFHLMRAMECAVGALATKLGIPHPDREWGKRILVSIHAKNRTYAEGRSEGFAA